MDPLLGSSPIDVIINKKNSFNMDWERDHCGRKHNFICKRNSGNTDPVPTRTPEPQNEVCPRSYTEIGILFPANYVKCSKIYLTKVKYQSEIFSSWCSHKYAQRFKDKYLRMYFNVFWGFFFEKFDHCPSYGQSSTFQQ